MAKIKSTDSSGAGKDVVSNWTSPILLVGMQKSVATLKKWFGSFSSSSTHTHTIYNQVIPLNITTYIPQRNQNLQPHKNLYTNVHSSFMCDTSKMKTIQMHFNR